MAKHSGGSFRWVIDLVAIVALAGVPVAAGAEGTRPSPGDKPPADGAKPRIRVLQQGTYRPAIPAPHPGQARMRPMSPDEKKKAFGTDIGPLHLTLSVRNPFVDGKGYLIFHLPGEVAPAQGEAIFFENQGGLHLSLHVQPKKFYFIDLTVSPMPWDKTKPCGFEVTWPDKANEFIACHGETKEHVLLGFQAPPDASTIWLTFKPKQRTSFFQLEVTSK